MLAGCPEYGACPARLTHHQPLDLMSARAIERAVANGWTYDCECPEAGVGWTRLKRTRPAYKNCGTRVDFDYVAPDGKRFYSTGVKVRRGRGAASSAQRFQDCAAACAACGLDEDAPGNDIVICDGGCGLAFHQHCLVDPLWTIPEGKWLCPGCVEDSISRLPRFHDAPSPSGAPPCERWSGQAELRSEYELDLRALRPCCTNPYCGGEARHAPAESEATAFRCELCGTQLKSRWWW